MTSPSQALKELISPLTDAVLEPLITRGHQLFSASPELERLHERTGRDLFSIGTYLGEARRRFEPTPALIDWIGEHTERKVAVNAKGEWLFMCGRDLFEQSITCGKQLRGPVVVVNTRGEALGLGEATAKRPWVVNTFDRGWYLRREGKR